MRGYMNKHEWDQVLRLVGGYLDGLPHELEDCYEVLDDGAWTEVEREKDRLVNHVFKDRMSERCYMVNIVRYGTTVYNHNYAYEGIIEVVKKPITVMEWVEV